MNLQQKANFAMFLALFVSSTLFCFSQKQAASNFNLQDNQGIQFNEVNFQEWFAGIKVGGTGYNIFLSNITNDENVILETVYFRNLSGKIQKDNSKYVAVLKNSSPYYTWEYPKKPSDYPFDLGADECVIGYRENGALKYYKIANIVEKAGTYYENGPPSIYQNEPSSVVATAKED